VFIDSLVYTIHPEAVLLFASRQPAVIQCEAGNQRQLKPIGSGGP